MRPALEFQQACKKLHSKLIFQTKSTWNRIVESTVVFWFSSFGYLAQEALKEQVMHGEQGKTDISTQEQKNATVMKKQWVFTHDDSILIYLGEQVSKQCFISPEYSVSKYFKKFRPPKK